jgi:hypothetical protein
VLPSRPRIGGAEALRAAKGRTRVHAVETDEGVTLLSNRLQPETHSLRPLSSRATKARDASAGLGWLVWPFVLFVTTGAVVGTLWFRKKTE